MRRSPYEDAEEFFESFTPPRHGAGEEASEGIVPERFAKTFACASQAERRAANLFWSSLNRRPEMRNIGLTFGEDVASLETAPTVIDPFPAFPFVFDIDTNVTKLNNAVAAIKADSDLGQMCAAVVDLTDKPNQMPYAGFNDTQMLYVGSLLKIAPFYVAFELRNRSASRRGPRLPTGSLRRSPAGRTSSSTGSRRPGRRRSARRFPGCGRISPTWPRSSPSPARHQVHPQGEADQRRQDRPRREGHGPGRERGLPVPRLLEVDDALVQQQGRVEVHLPALASRTSTAASAGRQLARAVDSGPVDVRRLPEQRLGRPTPVEARPGGRCRQDRAVPGGRSDFAANARSVASLLTMLAQDFLLSTPADCKEMRSLMTAARGGARQPGGRRTA